MELINAKRTLLEIEKEKCEKDIKLAESLMKKSQNKLIVINSLLEDLK